MKSMVVLLDEVVLAKIDRYGRDRLFPNISCSFMVHKNSFSWHILYVPYK